MLRLRAYVTVMRKRNGVYVMEYLFVFHQSNAASINSYPQGSVRMDLRTLAIRLIFI